MTIPYPPDLPTDQHPLWDATCQRLPPGTTPHPDLIRAYVSATHQHHQATRILDQTGPMIERDGRAIPNPAAAAAQDWATTMTRLARQLGLTRRATPQQARQAPPPMQGQEGPKLARWRELHGADPVPAGRWCEDHGRWEGTCHNHGGGTCHNPKAEGLSTCRMHPGPDGKIRHLAAVAMRQRPAVDRVDIQPLDVHPAVALLNEVRYWAGLCAWLDEIIAGLAKDEMVWGMIRRQDAQSGEFPGVTVIEAAQLNTWVAWHQRSHEHLAKVADMALRAEIDAVALRANQAWALQSVKAYQRALDQIGLTAEQWQRAREVFPQVLRELGTVA